MTATAKIFMTGNSQAVRLPKAFRLDAKEVWISRNEATGEIVLKPMSTESQREREVRDLLEAVAAVDEHDNFLPPRDAMETRDPFADWVLDEGVSPKDGR